MAWIRGCKVGTIPSLVVWRYNYKPTVGKVMEIRYAEHGSKFFEARVIGVIDGGSYVFFEKC